MVNAGLKEAAICLIMELFKHNLCQAAGFAQPTQFKGAFIEGNQAADQGGVIFQIGIQSCLIGLVGAIEFPIGLAQVGQHEVCRFGGRGQGISAA